MGNTHPEVSQPTPSVAQQNTYALKPSTFRDRGFAFLKQAGTNRKSLSELMWQSPQIGLQVGAHWLRYRWLKVKPQPIAPKNAYFYSPPVADPENFAFVLVGDTGLNSPGQYLVTTALSRLDLYPSEFCMILGDVVYPSGSESHYRFGFLEAFKHYPKPVLAIPGNHDWYDNLKAFNKVFVHGNLPKHLRQQYDRPTPQLPHHYYAMDLGQTLRIICLDTGLTGTLDPYRRQQLAWLDEMLDTAGDRKVILMMHHPLYALAQRPHEPALQKLLCPRLKKANIVAVFSGHDHNYQRHVIDGCQHIIQGAGGSTLHTLPTARLIHHPNGALQVLTRQHSWDTQFSFTYCRWQNNQLTCTTFSAHELPGRVLDRFLI